MTEQNPQQPAVTNGNPGTTTTGAGSATYVVQNPAPPAKPQSTAAEKQPPWGDKPENFDADKAWEMIQNLRAEKSDPTFRAELDQFKQQQTAQRDALAAALGLKPEETSDADKLAAQIDSLRGQITASERRALAIEYKVPEAMLTATDAAEMRKQAEALVEFAQASHYAASTAAPQTPPPAFQQNPGQGQGNTPPSNEALADAEYEKYYPSPK